MQMQVSTYELTILTCS